MVSIIKTGTGVTIGIIADFHFFAEMPKNPHRSIINCSETSLPPLFPGVWGFLFISVAEKQPGFSNPLGWPGFAKPGETKQP